MRYNRRISDESPHKKQTILKGIQIMKKILSLALAALMLVSCIACFASCGDTITGVKVIEVRQHLILHTIMLI